MRGPASLEACDLACVRGGRRVFEGLNFSLAAGGVLALEGPNGAGKSSALRIVAGLLPEAAGTVSIRTDGRAVTGREERGHLCALVGHQDGVKAQLTAAENARFFAALYGGRADVDAVLDRVGLAVRKDAPAQYLSAGQKRRLALARLLVANRPVWLLDEPLAALDAAGRALVAELIARHCGEGGIVVAATHEPLGVPATQLVLAP